MPSTDYRKERVGQPRKSVKGVMLLDGGMYCPSTPNHLKTAVKDFREGSIDRATFVLRREERRSFRVHVKEQTNSQGKFRVSCPARGDAPSVTCPIIEMSKKATSERDRPAVQDAPDFLDEICRQHAVTMDYNDNIRDMQAFEFGSDEWETFHRMARNSIESTNKQVKEDAVLNIELASLRPARGFAAAALFTTLRIVSFNLAKIAAFLHDVATQTQTGRADRDKPRARRRERLWYNRYTKTLPQGQAFPQYIEERLANVRERAQQKKLTAQSRSKRANGALPSQT